MSLALVLLGGAAGLAVLIGSGRALLAWCGCVPRGADLWRALYANVEWLAAPLLAIWVGAIWAGDRLLASDRRFVTHIGWGARWWEYLTTGAVMIPMALAFTVAFLGPLAVVGVLLPYRLIVDNFLTGSPTLAGVIVSIPFVVAAIGVLVTFALVWSIGEAGGSLVGDEGKLLTPRQGGGTGGGTKDLGSVYYFSCLALLGAGFGEYKPTGSCRAITLVAVLVGRILEVVLIGISANLLANAFGR